jgi:hypothetical protein
VTQRRTGFDARSPKYGASQPKTASEAMREMRVSLRESRRADKERELVELWNEYEMRVESIEEIIRALQTAEHNGTTGALLAWLISNELERL